MEKAPSVRAFPASCERWSLYELAIPGPTSGTCLFLEVEVHVGIEGKHRTTPPFVR